jgi:hypothetical protein
MNKTYEISFLDEPTPNHANEYSAVELGTFSGTIYKTQYRSNGNVLPSDTGKQLIADRLT